MCECVCVVASMCECVGESVMNIRVCVFVCVRAFEVCEFEGRGCLCVCVHLRVCVCVCVCVCV